MTDSIKRTLLPLDPKKTARRAIPDIPQSSLDTATVRTILSAVKERLDQMSGDGPESVLTLQRAVEKGLVVPKPRNDGGGNNVWSPIDPNTGFGQTTWSGHVVPPPPEDVWATPGDVTELEAFGTFGGVYLTWTCPARTGGFFRIYRARVNDRDQAIVLNDRVTSLLYYDSTAQVLDAEGNALDVDYYYWVQSYTIPPANSAADIPRFGAWSSAANAGVHWVLDPNTFARITADNILAGRLKVVLDLDVGGAIRSGKELLEDGTVSTAAGFFINGNYFYFGSEADESYIKWSGDRLSIRGDIYASHIYGGVVEGATLAGTWVFADYLLWNPSDPAFPLYGIYQNEYAPYASGNFETRYLIRDRYEFGEQSETLYTDGWSATQERSYVTYAEWVEEIELDATLFTDAAARFPFDIPAPFDFPNANTVDRAKDHDSVWFEFANADFVAGTPLSLDLYTDTAHSVDCLHWRANPMFCITVERTYHDVEFDEYGNPSFSETSSHVETDSFTWCIAGTPAFDTTVGDPLYPGTFSFGTPDDTTAVDDSFLFLYANAALTSFVYTHPNGWGSRFVRTPGVWEAPAGRGASLFHTQLSNHQGALKKIRVFVRAASGCIVGLHTYPSQTPPTALAGSREQLRSKFRFYSDNHR